MGNRAKLLATVALPIVSIIWQPADAAAFRATLQPVDAAGGVILAQSNDNGDSEEELRRKRREQREQERQEGGSDRNKERQERQSDRNKERQERQSDRNQEQQERQSDRNKERQERQSDRNREQQERQSDRNREQQERQSDRNKERQERQSEGNQKQQQEQKSDRQREQQERQSDRNKERQERQSDRNREQQERQSDRNQEQQERQSDRNKERQERQSDRNQEQQERQSDRAKEQQERKSEQAKERQDGQTDRERAREERRKKAESDRERRADEENRQRPRRERDAERERIARDPSKTTETIDLPVVGGAAVLDSDKDADRRGGSREESRRKREEERRKASVRVPRSDADAQVDRDGNRRRYDRHESIDRERGERRDRRPDYRDPDNVRIGRREDNRVIYNIDNRTFVRHYDSDRLSRRGGNTYYETLRDGRIRETIERPGGVRVVTIRNDYGEVIQRSRFVGDREYVLYYVPEVDYVYDRPFYDPGLDLPPMRLSVPVDEYIIDTSSGYDRDYREFLDLPPVEPVERVYTLDEVKYSARIRDKVRRIDLDTITFATGSAEISMEQASTLRQVADAINELLDEDPSETFLIEGHTDAVGSDDSNLILSDERAESVANVLTDVYDIPPENLSTQGYGERYLKVATDGPEQLNRRVTIRRVTPLVKPVASAE